MYVRRFFWKIYITKYLCFKDLHSSHGKKKYRTKERQLKLNKYSPKIFIPNCRKTTFLCLVPYLYIIVCLKLYAKSNKFFLFYLRGFTPFAPTSNVDWHFNRANEKGLHDQIEVILRRSTRRRPWCHRYLWRNRLRSRPMR